MHPDKVVAAFAGRQHGGVAFRPLIEAGLTREAVARRVESGHLIRVHRGVYLVGHTAAPEFAREAAALLATGPHAVLSHHSAAKLWGLADHHGPVHVSVTHGQPRHRPGIRVHRPNDLGPEHIRTKHTLSLTSPARTLTELRSHLSAAQHERLTSEAMVKGLVPREPDGITRSDAERRLLRLVNSAGLPRPQTNARIAGYEVDLLWREQRLVVEVDGYAVYGHRLAFERDRDKQQALTAAGLRVSRVTWRQLDRPHQVIARLAQAFATNPPTAPPARSRPRVPRTPPAPSG